MSPSAPTGPSRRSAPARYAPPAWKPTPGSTRTPARRSIAPTRWRCFRASGQYRRHMRAQYSIRYVTQRAEWSCEASCDSSTSSDALLAYCQLPGPNLAKGDFLAKYSRSAIQSSEKSARYTGQNTRNAALSGREVCTMRRLRSFEHTGGSNQDERAVETGQNAWSNRQNELVVSVLALWW